jgi:hypothetical protein
MIAATPKSKFGRGTSEALAVLAIFIIAWKIVALAAHHAVPTIYSFRSFAESGGLMSYSTNLVEVYRQVGLRFKLESRRYHSATVSAGQR